MANLVTDYIDLINHLKCLALNHLDDKEERNKFQNEFEDFLTTETKSTGNIYEHRKYKDLIKSRFELTKVVRIEHTNYINSVFGKTNDLTEKTLTQLIKEGKADAWISLIKDDIMNLKLNIDVATTNNIQDILVNKLDQVANYLKENDFENNEGAYKILAEFIDEIDRNKQAIDNQLRPGKSDKLKRSAEAFGTSLEQML